MRTVALLLACASCAGTQVSAKGGPRGIHADEHLAMANAEGEQEFLDTTWPDPQSSREQYNAIVVPFEPANNYIPGQSHADYAIMHRFSAAALQLEYERACGARPAAEVMSSPLRSHAIGTFDTENGVAVYLTEEAGSADKVLADVRCYRAWMMLSSRSDPDDNDPLDLPLDIHAVAQNGGVTVTLGSDDPATVQEVQRRTHLLEARSLPPRTR